MFLGPAPLSALEGSAAELAAGAHSSTFAAAVEPSQEKILVDEDQPSFAENRGRQAIAGQDARGAVPAHMTVSGVLNPVFQGPTFDWIERTELVWRDEPGPRGEVVGVLWR